MAGVDRYTGRQRQTGGDKHADKQRTRQTYRMAGVDSHNLTKRAESRDN